MMTTVAQLIAHLQEHCHPEWEVTNSFCVNEGIIPTLDLYNEIDSKEMSVELETLQNNFYCKGEDMVIEEYTEKRGFFRVGICPVCQQLVRVYQREFGCIVGEHILP